MLVDQLFSIREVAPVECQPAYLITEVLFLVMLQVGAPLAARIPPYLFRFGLRNFCAWIAKHLKLILIVAIDGVVGSFWRIIKRVLGSHA